MYEYSKSIKSSLSDELINSYVLRPLANIVVRILYRSRITPNQVTVASIFAGFMAAFAYLKNNPMAIACAGLLVTIKDVLDSADGQLARAKQLYSRSGRFLDSIADYIVDVALFAAIGWVLTSRHESINYGFLALIGLVGITFRVSYHVFYQASYLHLQRVYETNRITEELSEEDKMGDPLTLRLQRIFQVIYGWQDRLVLRIDGWCKGVETNEGFQQAWYSDVWALRLSGFMGMGTELFLLTACSLLDRLELYLFINAVVMNVLLLVNILYRRLVLREKLST